MIIDVTAIIGLCITVLTIISWRNVSKKHKTLDVLNDADRDPRLTEAFKTIRWLNHEGKEENPAKYTHPTEQESQKAADIKYVLNHFERVCVGVHEGVYSEKIVWRTTHSVLVGAYNTCKPFIMECRRQTERGTLYIEIENLAERWSNKPLVSNHGKQRQSWWHFWD